MAEVDWREDAACRDADPEVFFLADGEHYKPGRFDKAREICGGCPVIEQCKKRADKKRESWGFWHGKIRDKDVRRTVVFKAGLEA